MTENWTSPKNVRDSGWKEGPGIESGTGKVRTIEFMLHGVEYWLRIWTFLGRAEFFDASADDPVATRKAIHQLRLVQQGKAKGRGWVSDLHIDLQLGSCKGRRIIHRERLFKTREEAELDQWGLKVAFGTATVEEIMNFTTIAQPDFLQRVE